QPSEREGPFLQEVYPRRPRSGAEVQEVSGGAAPSLSEEVPKVARLRDAQDDEPDCQLRADRVERQHRYFRHAAVRLPAEVLESTYSQGAGRPSVLACFAGGLGGDGVSGFPRYAPQRHRQN